MRPARYFSIIQLSNARLGKFCLLREFYLSVNLTPRMLAPGDLTARSCKISCDAVQ